MKFILSWLLAAVVVLSSTIAASAATPQADAPQSHAKTYFPRGVAAGGGSGSPCPKGTAYPDDGCAALYAAGLQGTYQNSTCLSDINCALGSGQTFVTRAPWNIAGIDFPTGVPQNVNGTGVLKDPAAGGLPAGCAYNATGSATGQPVITCSFTNNLDFKGFEMCSIGGHDPTVIDIKGNRTGTSTIEQNHWCGSLNNTGGTSVNFETASTVGDVAFNYNTVDGGCISATTCPFFSVTMNTSGGKTAHYNAINGIQSRPFGAGTGALSVGPTDFRWNYFGGFQYVNNGVHGEALIDVMSQVANVFSTEISTTYAYNTIVNPKAVQSGQITTNIYMSGGGAPTGPPTWTTTLIDGNTLVANIGADSAPVSAQVDFQNGTFTNVTVSNNYVNTTGTIGTFRADCNQPSFTANIDSSNIIHVSGANPSSNSIVANTTAGSSYLYYGGAATGIQFDSQLTSTSTQHVQVTGATIAGNQLTWTGSLTGSGLAFADMISGTGVPTGVVYLSSCGTNCWNVSSTPDISTPFTATTNKTGFDGTYSLIGATGPVSSQTMIAYAGRGNATFPNGVTMFGNVNMETGGSMNTFNFKNNCRVFGPP